MAQHIFDQKVPGIMRKLMSDFRLSEIEAGAIAGNLGHESGGFLFLQEKKPMVPGSRGGYGWAQWTGPRRRKFEAYCSRNNLDPASDKANYGFLFVELTGPEKSAIPAVKTAIGLMNKVKAFEKAFERAGIKHYDSRLKWAERALRAYDSAQPPVPAPPPPDIPKPEKPAVAPPVSFLTRVIRLFKSLFKTKGVK